MGRLFVLLGIVAAAAVAFFALSTGNSGGAAQNLLLPEGKVFRVAMEAEPKSLDPIGITDVFSDGVGRKVYNTLVRVERQGENELKIVPDLAESLPEISADGTVYVFKLRKGVKFHNGREMKASDAVFSLVRLLQPNSERADWMKPFVKGSEARYKSGNESVPVGITAIDDYTLKIELEKPFAPFIQHLCTVNCAVIPREATLDKDKPLARNPVGTGPFKVVQWIDNNTILLARHDSYHHGKPKLAGIRYSILKETSVRMEKFYQGELDCSDIAVGKLKEARDRAPEAIFQTMTFRTNYLGFGFPTGKYTEDPDLQLYGKNKLLRQALNYAIDREYLCNVVLEGKGKPAKSVLPPGFPGYKEREGWKKDLKKAKELLAQAGYPEGKDLPPLNVYAMNETDVKIIAQAIVNDICQTGINAQLVTRERNQFYKMVGDKPHQSYLLGWVADYYDPHNFLYVLFQTQQAGHAGNHTWYSNPQVDKLVEDARDLVKMEDRVPLYQKAEDIILDESPWIVTYHAVNIVLLSPKVKGIRERMTSFDTGVEFSNIDFSFVDIE